MKNFIRNFVNRITLFPELSQKINQADGRLDALHHHQNTQAEQAEKTEQKIRDLTNQIKNILDGETDQTNPADIKVPTIEVGLEGRIQVLEEKLQAVQKRLDVISLNVAKIERE